jgi:hypothetical protein
MMPVQQAVSPAQHALPQPNVLRTMAQMISSDGMPLVGYTSQDRLLRMSLKV